MNADTPRYRRVSLRVFAEAAPDSSGGLAEALARALAGYGQVRVDELGTYWKMPEYLEFGVDLTPDESADECAAALRALEPGGWHGDNTWRIAGRPFLHPAVRWASLHTQEASTPPLFSAGEVVVIGDCSQAREHGLVNAQATVCGWSAGERWGYAVRPAGMDTLFSFDEPDLRKQDPILP